MMMHLHTLPHKYTTHTHTSQFLIQFSSFQRSKKKKKESRSTGQQASKPAKPVLSCYVLFLYYLYTYMCCSPRAIHISFIYSFKPDRDILLITLLYIDR